MGCWYAQSHRHTHETFWWGKSVAFSPDGRLLASGSGGTVGTVILWSVETRQPIRQPLKGHTKWVDIVAFSPDGKTLVSSGGEDVIILWDIASLHRLATILPGYEGSTDSVAFSRDSAVVASGICIETDGATSRHWTQCRQGGIRLWSRASGKELPALRAGYPGTPRSLVFRNDANTLVSSSCAKVGGDDCTRIGVQVWNIGTGRFERYAINDDRPRLDNMALSPSGEIIAAGSCKSGSHASCDPAEIRLWNVQTGRQIGAPLIGHSRPVRDLAFSPDGQTLASITLDDIILWNVSTGRPRGRPQPGSQIAFTFDGKISAVSAPPASEPPRTITLRDTSTNQPIGQLTIGDHDVVLRMVFSPDGKILAVSNVSTNTSTSSISLWDVARGERLGQPLEWRGERVFAVEFSPDGKTLVAAPEDHGLISWDVNLESWRERACGIANRNLTYEEWTQFLGEEPYRATCPTLLIDPNIVEAGRRRARAGDIEGAMAIFTRALELNPALKLDPKKEAIKSSVEELVAQGNYLAESGDVEGGAVSLERAKRLDPGLALDPLAEARKLAAPGVIAEGEQLAQQGKIAESIAAFARAQEFDPALKVSGRAWNTLCWIGSLQGRVAEVMDAWEKAVRSDPDDGRFRTSRGLAKAMVQKVDESISDFEAFLTWEKGEEQTRMGLSRREWLRDQRLRHEGWIAALRTGQNPFTPEELKRLLDDKSSE